MQIVEVAKICRKSRRRGSVFLKSTAGGIGRMDGEGLRMLKNHLLSHRFWKGAVKAGKARQDEEW